MAELKCPWLGFKTYTEEDAEFFRGRTQEISELMNMLKSDDAVVCYSDSGVGKSSLLNAGLKPQINKCFDWFTCDIKFRTDFFSFSADYNELIISSLKSTKGISIQSIVDLESEEWLRKLDAEMKGNAWWYLRTNVFSQAITCGNLKADFNKTPLLVFDQFEEIFKLVKDDKQTDRFFDFIRELFSDSLPDILVEKIKGNEFECLKTKLSFLLAKNPFKSLFLIRKDSIGELDYWCTQKKFIWLFKKARYCLMPLTLNQAKEIIDMPSCDLLMPYTERILNLVKDKNEDTVSSMVLSVLCKQFFELSRKKGNHAVWDFLKQDNDVNKLLEDAYSKKLNDSEIPKKVISVLERELVNVRDGKEYRQRLPYDSVASKFGLIYRKDDYSKAIENSSVFTITPLRIGDELTKYIEVTHDRVAQIIAIKKKKAARIIKIKCGAIATLFLFFVSFLFVFSNNHDSESHVKEYGPVLHLWADDNCTDKMDTIRRGEYVKLRGVRKLVIHDNIYLEPYSVDASEIDTLVFDGRNIKWNSDFLCSNPNISVICITAITQFDGSNTLRLPNLSACNVDSISSRKDLIFDPIFLNIYAKLDQSQSCGNNKYERIFYNGEGAKCIDFGDSVNYNYYRRVNALNLDCDSVLLGEYLYYSFVDDYDSVKIPQSILKDLSYDKYLSLPNVTQVDFGELGKFKGMKRLFVPNVDEIPKDLFDKCTELCYICYKNGWKKRPQTLSEESNQKYDSASILSKYETIEDEYYYFYGVFSDKISISLENKSGNPVVIPEIFIPFDVTKRSCGISSDFLMSNNIKIKNVKTSYNWHFFKFYGSLYDFFPYPGGHLKFPVEDGTVVVNKRWESEKLYSAFDYKGNSLVVLDGSYPFCYFTVPGKVSVPYGYGDYYNSISNRYNTNNFRELSFLSTCWYLFSFHFAMMCQYPNPVNIPFYGETNWLLPCIFYFVWGAAIFVLCLVMICRSYNVKCRNRFCGFLVWFTLFFSCACLLSMINFVHWMKCDFFSNPVLLEFSTPIILFLIFVALLLLYGWLHLIKILGFKKQDNKKQDNKKQGKL